MRRTDSLDELRAISIGMFVAKARSIGGRVLNKGKFPLKLAAPFLAADRSRMLVEPPL